MVILLPFWVARVAMEKGNISQRRRFDLLLAAMPEKILDQVMDMVDNVSEDFSYDTLKSLLLETHTLSDHEKLAGGSYKIPYLWVVGSLPRRWPAC